ncbi:hypothetical protein NX059_009580 [Plenodomus lindquistii]|nr:hypothetical protein NX059_009580 [Plenodomus lindquistii]
MGLLSSLELHFSGAGWATTIALLTVILFATRALYNAFLHPLSKYPGPPFASFSRLWYCYHCYRGTLIYALNDAHKKYGDVIRTAPDELSFTDPGAWNDIYGHRIGKPEVKKDPTFYSTISSAPGSIILADHSRHGHLRRQASHGFSERYMRGQEHVIKRYADLMVHRLEECIDAGNPTVNIVDWYNFFTFDVMGDLVFGESFHCLENWGYHPWVKLIFDSVKASAFIRCTKHFPILAPLTRWFMPKDMQKRRTEQRAMALEKAEYRRSLNDGRTDLISGYLKPESGVTSQEYTSTAGTLITAGSETTATAMSGLTYYLLRDEERHKKLRDEIRGAFTSHEQITITAANKLPYLLACLDEGLRIYPPVPDTLPRNTGARAEVISNHVVPPNTTIGVSQWSTYHSPRNFKNPDDFIPERWMQGHQGYDSDRKAALQPFHVGPRNCLGRNLAFLEMRVLIARLFWEFDLELDSRSANWNDHKAYLLWEKPPMYVKIQRARAEK